MNDALRNQVIIELKNALFPLIAKEISHIKVKDVKTGDGSIEAHVVNINIHIDALNPSQYSIQFVGSSTIRVPGSALSMRGSAKAEA